MGDRTHCGTRRRWDTIPCQKETSDQVRKRHRRPLNAFYQVEEVSLKRPHTAWFQLYDIPKKAKLLRQYGQFRAAMGWGRSKETGSAQRIFKVVELLCMIDIRHYVFVKIHGIYNNTKSQP